MSFSAASKKRKSQGNKSAPTKIGMTQYTLKIVMEKPQFTIKTYGTNRIPFSSDTTFSSTFDSKNIYLSGYYLKYSRGLS